MLYKLSWIEKNLGISRKSLRVYEAKGFIKPIVNPDKNYKEFSREDVEQIWKIKLLVKLKFTLKEIEEILRENSKKSLNENSNFDLTETVDYKLSEIKEEVESNLRAINVLEQIKSKGALPEIPEDFGEITIDEYFESLLDR